MTARGLIDSIFTRAQPGVAGNVRRITLPQLDLLRRLIAEDREAGAMHADGLGVAVWKPAGREKFVITEDLRGDRHTLARAPNFSATMGSLF